MRILIIQIRKSWRRALTSSHGRTLPTGFGAPTPVHGGEDADGHALFGSNARAYLLNLRRCCIAVRASLLVIFGLCSASWVYADWAEQEVSWRCDERAGTFSLRPVVDTSSGPKVELLPGFVKVAGGHHSEPPYTTTVICRLPGADVKAEIYARAETYQLTLWLNKTAVFENELLNSGLGFEPVLYQLDIASHGKDLAARVTACFGNWSWDSNYERGTCKAVGKP